MLIIQFRTASRSTPSITQAPVHRSRNATNRVRSMAEETKANPSRFGIIGFAEIARRISRAIGLSPNAVVSAVGSRSEEKARQFAVANGLPSSARAHGTYEGVLADPCVDAVYVPLPTSLHVLWAVAAAERGKHVLLEKPCALCATDLDLILETCRTNGVQFMDGTMWMHHPRTAKMRQMLDDPDQFGQLKWINCMYTFTVHPDFLESDIRVKPNLDGLGALGDIGWYCIRMILWAANYKLPKTAVALRGTVMNSAGVILSCGSSLQWEDGTVATFHCSFFSNQTMDVCAMGTRGTLHLSDFAIPFENSSAKFSFASDSGYTELVTGWKPLPSTHVVTADLPQDVLMIIEFSRLARSIRDSGAQPDEYWPAITRKTQLVLDAVKESIERGFEPVEITG